MYLGNINAKSDPKSIPLFNQLPFCPCEEPNHQMYTLNMICIEKTCNKKGLICVMCNYENHRQHSAIPVKIFLDKYRQSYFNFQIKQNKDELKIESIKEVNMETLNILKNFQAKITYEINTLQASIQNFLDQEIKSFNEEEENNKDPLIKMIGIEDNCNTKQAVNLVSKLLERIIYKENEVMDIENLSFSHSNNDVLIQKFEAIKQKAQDTQDLISKTLDMEFKNFHKVFTQMENKFGVVEEEYKPINLNEEEPFFMKKLDVFNIKSNFSAFCLLEENINNENIEFLITDPEDNRFKLFRINDKNEQPIILDLHMKYIIKKLEYSKKLQLLIGIDAECNLFTIKYTNDSPYLLPNWTSHHYKDLFYKAEVNTIIMGNYLIVGVKTFIYILNITNEGIIETKVKIEINGVLEFLCKGNNENEVLFLWNQQNALKKFVSILEVEKGIIRNLDMIDINYQLKSFLFYKELQAYVLWGNEFKGNKEFLEIIQNSKRNKFYMDGPMKVVHIDDVKQIIYLFPKNNYLERIKFEKNQ